MQTIAPVFYMPMHDVVPRVVAIAVRMVMAMCRIFCQMLLVSIVSCLVMSYEFGGCFFTTE